MMLLGMALFKWGVLSAHKSKGFYLKLTFIGLMIGYPVIILGIFENFSAGWKMDYSMFIGTIYNYIGSVAVALGYIGIIMLICKQVKFEKVKNIFAAIGKMAFSNYILMSLIAMFIFYGSGLGLFGQVERKFQLLIVIAIWIVIIVISPLWLRRFRFGALEWIWRILTYWKYQPLKLRKAE